MPKPNTANYFGRIRQSYKNKIRELLKTEIPDEKIIITIAKITGWKHSTIEILISEVKQEEGIYSDS